MSQVMRQAPMMGSMQPMFTQMQPMYANAMVGQKTTGIWGQKGELGLGLEGDFNLQMGSYLQEMQPAIGNPFMGNMEGVANMSKAASIFGIGNVDNPNDMLGFGGSWGSSAGLPPMKRFSADRPYVVTPPAIVAQPGGGMMAPVVRILACQIHNMLMKREVQCSC